MASIRREMVIEAPPNDVWPFVMLGALHTRLVPGFVVDTRLEDGARVVTFGNGLVARELIVDIDDGARELVWAVVGSPRLAYHNASVQVYDAGKGRSGFVWIADLCRTRPATASAPSSIKPWPSSKRQSSNSRTRAEGPKRWNRKLHSRRDAFGGRSEHELDPSEPARECAARDCLSCPSRCARRRDMDGAQRHDQPGGMHSSLVRAARFGSRSHTMNRREPARRPRMPTPTTVAS